MGYSNGNRDGGYVKVVIRIIIRVVIRHWVFIESVYREAVKSKNWQNMEKNSNFGDPPPSLKVWIFLTYSVTLFMDWVRPLPWSWVLSECVHFWLINCYRHGECWFFSWWYWNPVFLSFLVEEKKGTFLFKIYCEEPNFKQILLKEQNLAAQQIMPLPIITVDMEVSYLHSSMSVRHTSRGTLLHCRTSGNVAHDSLNLRLFQCFFRQVTMSNCPPLLL